MPEMWQYRCKKERRTPYFKRVENSLYLSKGSQLLCAERLCRETEMNIFKEHLNWALLFGRYSVTAISFWIMIFTGLQNDGVLIFLFFILFPIMWIITDVWYLKQKNRSLWYLLLNFVPFGLIFILQLENHSQLREGNV